MTRVDPETQRALAAADTAALTCTRATSDQRPCGCVCCSRERRERIAGLRREAAEYLVRASGWERTASHCLAAAEALEQEQARAEAARGEAGT